MLDIIIPVFNEERILIEKRNYFQNLAKSANIIFVDGGSADYTVKIAQSYGDVICSPKGRGLQKDRGAQHSQSRHLLFLHVDTCIDPSVVQEIDDCLNHGAIGGCLTLQIDDDRRLFSIFTSIVNFRAKNLNIIDGDLGLFVKRDAYEYAGCFDPFPYMEDILFSKRLRKIGKIVVLPNKIVVSSRKWHEQGFLKTFVRYAFAYLELWIKFQNRKVSVDAQHAEQDNINRVCPRT